MFREKRVFIDYNVIIDLINFNNESFDNEKFDSIIDLIQNDYEILISSEIILFIYHFLGKHEDQAWLITKLKELILLFEIVSVDKHIIFKALESVERQNANFEYKVQYLTALSYDCELFITNSRNKLGIMSSIEVIEL
jgi:uncharacterized membrane protein SirB2